MAIVVPTPPTTDAPASPKTPAAATNAAPPAAALPVVLLASEKKTGDDDDDDDDDDDLRRNAYADRPEDRSDDDAIDCSTRSTVFMLSFDYYLLSFLFVCLLSCLVFWCVLLGVGGEQVGV
jgi:hypothetical protein